MRTIVLTKLEKETLQECYTHHPKSHVRNRSQSLLLLEEGWRIKQIALLHHTLGQYILGLTDGILWV